MAYVNSLYFTLNAINIFNRYKKNLVHNDSIHDYKVSQNVSEDIIKSAKIDFVLAKYLASPAGIGSSEEMVLSPMPYVESSQL